MNEKEFDYKINSAIDEVNEEVNEYDNDPESGGLPLSTAPVLYRQEKKSLRKSFIAAVLGAAIAVSGVTSAGVTYWLNTRNTIAGTPSKDINIVTAYTPANSSDSSFVFSNDITEASEKGAASVVEISTEIRQVSPFSQHYITKGAGSGVILAEDGYIVTNNHVIEGAGSITVRTADGKEYKSSLIGTDAKTDLAVLKIEAAGLVSATFADSASIKVGEPAVVIGNPLGELGGTVTSGIISAKDREINIGEQTMTLLQTSAAVNPGNSGGGLFDRNGNLVGIVNAKSSGSDIEGLAFAIPSNTVKEVVAEIIANGYVTGRPQLGISIVEVSDTRSAFMYGLNETGVYVYAVLNKNGLEAGDRIISINDEIIKSKADISSLLQKYTVGDAVTVEVARNGHKVSLQVILSEQKPLSLQPQLQSASS
ncbi:MAG: trypsin-like peptidase domain-containing protein [Syntrophomonadaceae bacterium]|jgi:serine protease Do|nr:trypsin-like peptidase domain-containing protein [Syntrophomonadaceae bacterium]